MLGVAAVDERVVYWSLVVYGSIYAIKLDDGVDGRRVGNQRKGRSQRVCNSRESDCSSSSRVSFLFWETTLALWSALLFIISFRRLLILWPASTNSQPDLQAAFIASARCASLTKWPSIRVTLHYLHIILNRLLYRHTPTIYINRHQFKFRQRLASNLLPILQLILTFCRLKLAIRQRYTRYIYIYIHVWIYQELKRKYRDQFPAPKHNQINDDNKTKPLDWKWENLV